MGGAWPGPHGWAGQAGREPGRLLQDPDAQSLFVGTRQLIPLPTTAEHEATYSSHAAQQPCSQQPVWTGLYDL